MRLSYRSVHHWLTVTVHHWLTVTRTGGSNAPCFSMKVIVLQPTIIGGVDYQPSMNGQYSNVPDSIGEHMINIGNAKAYETKVVEVAEKKPSPETLSVSPQAQVSPEQIVKPRRGRPPKSSL